MLSPNVQHLKTFESDFEGEQAEFQDDLLSFPCQTSPSEGTPTLTTLRALAPKYEADVLMLEGCMSKGGHMSVGKRNMINNSINENCQTDLLNHTHIPIFYESK